MRAIAILLLFTYLSTSAQKTNVFEPANLKIDWQLISNNYKGKDQYLFSFKLTNLSKKAILPTDGWSIYYNANNGIVDKNLSSGLESNRLNGDLFYLKPSKDFKGLKPGESMVAEGVADAWVFTKSDAPSGFYWVWNNNQTKTYAITNITVTPPADINKFKRSPNEKGDQVTPEMVYDRNANITDIEISALPKIFPTPVSYVQGEGKFQINSSTIISHSELFIKEAQYLSATLSEFMNNAVPIGKGNDNIIQLILDNSQPKEGYKLEVNRKGIVIAASDAAGIFYGIQSLKSLLPLQAWRSKQSSLEVNSAIVVDQPRFGYRGLHIDVARNFQTKEEIKRILNWMSMYKLNTLHFHFSEDEAWRVEIPALPELTSVGATRGHSLDSKDHLPSSYGSGGDVKNIQISFYTRNDYIEILRYAKERHIELIPEIETPGHARAAIKAMDARYDRLMKEGKPEAAKEYLLSDADDKSVYLSAQNFNDNIMCVGLPSVYRFIETTVDALISMHNEADMPLKTIHIGGDEVPQGVWERSPVVQNLLKTLPKEKYKQTSDIWIYYWSKVNEILKSRNLYLSGWEEIGMRESKVDGNRVMMVNPEFANNNFHTYVWNTVIGWGAEDLPYRLANGGYKVILCPVSNVYFDLAYQKDFNETGYYWGGFVDVDKSFYFIPYDYLKNTAVDRFGAPVDPAILKGKDKLTDYGKSNIMGIQGELWSENMRSKNDLEYLAFPKILGLVERNWAQDPDWAKAKDPDSARKLYEDAWSIFTNTLGKKELFKLNYYQGGVNFRIPTVGAKVINGMVYANIQLPGLAIRYTTDGSEPTTSSNLYTSPINQKGMIKFRAFDSMGRGGRTIQVSNN